MGLTVCAVVLGLTMSGVPSATPSTGIGPAQRVAAGAQTIRPAMMAAWQTDRVEKRPLALPVMYATFGALQGLDVYSTHRALDAGSREANPVVRPAARHAGAMIAAKAISSVATVYFVERAWKKNRKGAIVLMAAINGMTAAVAARNFRNAHR